MKSLKTGSEFSRSLVTRSQVRSFTFISSFCEGETLGDGDADAAAEADADGDEDALADSLSAEVTGRARLTSTLGSGVDDAAAGVCALVEI